MAKKKTTPKKTTPKKAAAKKVAPAKAPVVNAPEGLNESDTNEQDVSTEETWRDRVVVEAKELKVKMVALKAALDGGKVPVTERVILRQQYDAMHAYYVILNTRLSNS